MTLKPALGIYLCHDTADWVSISKKKHKVIFFHTRHCQLSSEITTPHNICACLSDELMPVKIHNLEGRMSRTTIKQYIKQVTKGKLSYAKVIAKTRDLSQLLLISISINEIEYIIELLQPLGKIKSITPYQFCLSPYLPRNTRAVKNRPVDNTKITKLRQQLSKQGVKGQLNLKQIAAYAQVAKS